MKVKCTVALSTYNSQKTLRDTLDSLAAQDSTEFTVHAIDDASSDDSWKILQEYQTRYPERFHIQRREQNRGVAFNFLEVFRSAQTPYLSWIGSDDVWDKNFISAQLENLEKTKAVASFSAVKTIDETGQPVSSQVFDHSVADLSSADKVLYLLVRNPFCASSAVFKRELGFGFSNDKLQDHEQWLALALQGEFVHCLETSVGYRIVQNSMSRKVEYELLGKYNHFSMLNRIFRFPQFHTLVANQTDSAAYLRQIGERLWDLGHYSPLAPVLMLSLIEDLVASLSITSESGHLIFDEWAEKLGIHPGRSGKFDLPAGVENRIQKRLLPQKDHRARAFFIDPSLFSSFLLSEFLWSGKLRRTAKKAHSYLRLLLNQPT